MIDLGTYFDLNKEEIIIEGILFDQDVTFPCVDIESTSICISNCVFTGAVNIYSITSNDKFSIINTEFGSLEIGSCYFKDSFIISECTFNKTLTFINSTFLGKTILKKNVYAEGINVFTPNTDNFGIIAFEGGLIIS